MMLVLPVCFKKKMLYAVLFLPGETKQHIHVNGSPSWVGDVASTNPFPVLTNSGPTGCPSPTYNEHLWPRTVSGELVVLLVFRFLCFLRRKIHPYVVVSLSLSNPRYPTRRNNNTIYCYIRPIFYL